METYQVAVAFQDVRSDEEPYGHDRWARKFWSCHPVEKREIEAFAKCAGEFWRSVETRVVEAPA